MEVLLNLAIIIALVAVTAVCIYIIGTLSKVRVLVEEVQTLVRSARPVVSQLEATSARVLPVLDNAEQLLQKLQPVADNVSAMSSIAQGIAQKVDKHVDALLVPVRDAARLSRDVLRLLEEVRRQIITPLSELAGLVNALYKTITAMIGGGKAQEHVVQSKGE